MTHSFSNPDNNTVLSATAKVTKYTDMGVKRLSFLKKTTKDKVLPVNPTDSRIGGT